MATAPNDQSIGRVLVPPELIDHARSFIARGDLPMRPFPRVEAGYGRNEACRLCARPIELSQVRYRVQGSEGLGISAMMFHVHCYIAWEAAASGP